MDKKTIRKRIKILIKNMQKVEFDELPCNIDLKEMIECNQKLYKVYLGNFIELDPCNKYHDIFSLNGITKRCEKFWNNINIIINDLNCWMESDDLNLFLYQTRPMTIEDYKDYIDFIHNKLDKLNIEI